MGQALQRMWLIGVVAAVGVLIVAALVVALAGEETELDPGTPGRAVQEFIRAVERGDHPAVHENLSAELQAECTLGALATSNPGMARTIRDSRVTLEDTKVFDEVAIVTTKISTMSSGGPFGASENTRTLTFSLVPQDGVWRFSQSPWPVHGCGLRPGIKPPVRAPATALPNVIANDTTTQEKP